MSALTSFPQGFRAAVWGASGGIGRAFANHLAEDPACGEVVTLSRSGTGAGARHVTYDPADEPSLKVAAEEAAAGNPLHLVIVATGTLHSDSYQPEKALRQLEEDAFLEVMRINALLPALIAKASVNHLDKERSVFAALSARVGSISDNRLGGWHSYRASKSALNMLLRNIAIETARRNKGAVIAGIHPGTVDTGLSEPFQGNVPEGKLFTPEYSAGEMLKTLDGLTPENSGDCFDYAGKRIEF
ncbi:SDR family NAD(P)-dependent oxidoreductase [Parvularcula sp. ZS-1/3]|uniref:SDR family NAD(P)-dependent oxidoreductase n=1 Tax=Parvularcula mediterranea TaxID=2732508 RepID=A0A7Y3W5R7_9PROT|nr:SDR family NAD(P)-dependent oxidoreductase [Parvularcula mediterranea]NNU16778.1 SDR family NAD(P)-dependent oxidoreductase [Parvularcula mediterranea]